MSVAVLNSSTVTEFVEDGDAFNKCMEKRFSTLDIDGDGVLSRAELQKGFEGMGLVETEIATVSDKEIRDQFDWVFDKFDYDRSGTVDLAEFKSEMREIMLAVARGIGNSPVHVALEDGSFLKEAVELELSKSH